MLTLPPITSLEEYQGDWTAYLNAIYDFFISDFVKQKTRFDGRPIEIKKHPLINGKEATFWHLITEGSVEAERLPDLRRCETIRWPKPIIDNCRCSQVRLWENKRGVDSRICMCFGDWEYLVVLAKRTGYILLWTAYPITKEHTRKKLIKEYNEYTGKANTAR